MFGVGRIRIGLALLSAVALALSARAQDGAGGASGGPGEASVSDRIVHRFDFDERADGNLEDIPKYWEPLRPGGFPHYTRGAFDFTVGRNAAPSFHLSSEGRNVAYTYSGVETRIRPEVDYSIQGFIRADGLRSARACLSAHFLDRFGRPLTNTLVRSRYVGGAGSDEWVRVELHLPTAPSESHSIGVTAWVLRESTWRTQVPSERHIPRTDVRGGAWFDDITIHALPKIRISTGALGNVLAPGDVQELRVRLTDRLGVDTLADLYLNDADGETVETHAIPIRREHGAEAVRIPVDHLSPGWYRAVLTVKTGDAVVTSRTLSFARLPPVVGETGSVARPFGVVVDDRERADLETEVHLLTRQMVGAAKVPVWTSVDGGPDLRTDTDRFLHELTKARFALTAVLAGPPGEWAGNGRSRLSLIELLSGDRDVWAPHLAAIVAPYSGVYRWWQIGRDGEVLTGAENDIALAAEHVRDTMKAFTTMPRLALPAMTSIGEYARQMPVEQLSLSVGHEVEVSSLASVIERVRAMGYRHVSVYIDPLPADKYVRLARVSDWAQRIITARHAGAATVFVPQTWHRRLTPNGPVTEPDDLFVPLRVIADALEDALPGPAVPLPGNTRCLSFVNDTETVLAMWDPSAPPEGRSCGVQLGQADRQIDLWGNVRELGRDGSGRQIVHLSRVPVFVFGADRWLIEFRSAFSLKPDHVESGTEIARHEIEIVYGGDDAASGEIILQAPRAWSLSPRRSKISLRPRQTVRFPIEIRYPHNEPAGGKQIVARVRLDQFGYHVDVPLGIDLDLTDVTVGGSAIPSGDSLVLRHVVTNRSSSVLSFRGTADVPGRQRQYRPFANLEPDESQAVEYRFHAAAELAGRSARLVLRELNDGPRIHTLELDIP